MNLVAEKVDLHLWRCAFLVFFSQLGLFFFYCELFICRNRTKLMKLYYFNYKLKRSISREEYRLHWIFLSITAVMWFIFCTKDNLYFAFDYRNSFIHLTKSVKQFLNKQKWFSIPFRLNFESTIPIFMCSICTWFNIQILNFG